jgi:hypothetical protein
MIDIGRQFSQVNNPSTILISYKLLASEGEETVGTIIGMETG